MRRSIDFPDRLRVDVLLPQGQLAAVLTELRKFSSGDHANVTQVIRPQAIVIGDGTA